MKLIFIFFLILVNLNAKFYLYSKKGDLKLSKDLNNESRNSLVQVSQNILSLNRAIEGYLNEYNKELVIKHTIDIDTIEIQKERHYLLQKSNQLKNIKSELINLKIKDISLESEIKTLDNF